ncbi:MAG TPA: hypothetical protein VJ895_01595 [Candidatus Nanoarchaeia archaeon]|nr:hypothetical protein [Candidatus Nanoarchaeia archaeon]
MAKVAVLGSGVSGLLTAKALVDRGFSEKDITIFTKKKKQPQPRGFMILHDNCRMDLEMTKILMLFFGNKEKYKKKLGYDNDIECSWNKYTGAETLFGYNMFQAMDILYNRFENLMIQSVIAPDDVPELKNSYNHIISTIPPFNIYRDYAVEHVDIYITKKPTQNIDDIPRVIYYGDDTTLLRASENLFGWDFVEYSEPFEDSVKVHKPIKIMGKSPKDDKIIQVGRYGKWNKKILAHQVYWNIYGMTKKGSIQTS